MVCKPPAVRRRGLQAARRPGGAHQRALQAARGPFKALRTTRGSIQHHQWEYVGVGVGAGVGVGLGIRT